MEQEPEQVMPLREVSPQEGRAQQQVAVQLPEPARVLGQAQPQELVAD